MVLFALAGASPVSAQGLEAFGSRAAALQAFVAVADDASAVIWNPAGLVSGPLFNLQLDLGRSTDGANDAVVPGDRAGRLGTTLVSLGTTPVGLAYYRLSTTSLVADPAVTGTADRQFGRVRLRTLVTSHLGATVQQSIGEYLTLGATVKLVRGSVGATTVVASEWDDAFDAVEDVERDGSTRGDVDIGAMLATGSIRAGLVVRNVTAPTFGEDGDRATLDRHARIGIAWADRWPGISATVLSFDADLTRVAHPAGERRDVAAGVERWLGSHRFALRGGARVSTVGDARPVASAGGSYAVRAGIYVDAFVAGGAADHRGWGVGARVTY